jgi:hypothetical protein
MMYPKTKSGLIEAILFEREKLEAKISTLSPAELEFHGTMGEWSVKDILQHLVDWEQRYMSWYEAGKRGEAVHTPAPGYTWRQMGLLNEIYRQDQINRPLTEVLADFEASYQQIMVVVDSTPEAEMVCIGLYAWTGKLPLIAWIAGNTCEHYHWAFQMIHPVGIRRKMAASVHQ